jgi:DNA adenine methylase
VRGKSARRTPNMAVPVTHLYPSPLRYPGGKGKLSNFIKLVMLENELVGSEYVEIYAGGASVALSLLYEEYASHVHINDLNRSVHAFWTAVLEHTEELCTRIVKTKPTVSEWHRQRDVQVAKGADEMDLAFSTFFLNRTSRSGILNGGIIGGYDQLGEWKIDARWKPDDLARRVRRAARFRSRITLTGLDAAQYLRERVADIQNPFLYLDPPYYVKGSSLYEHFYRHDDHAEIASVVRAMPHPWLVSYDAAAAIDELYVGNTRLSYDLVYSAGARQNGREVMFLSPGLVPPGVASPAAVTAREVGATRIAALATI